MRSCIALQFPSYDTICYFLQEQPQTLVISMFLELNPQPHTIPILFSCPFPTSCRAPCVARAFRRTSHPWFSRRIYRTLRSLGAQDVTLSEIPDKAWPRGWEASWLSQGDFSSRDVKNPLFFEVNQSLPPSVRGVEQTYSLSG